MKYKTRLNTGFLIKIVCLFLLFAAVYTIIECIIKFSTIGNFINNISALIIVIMPCSLLGLTLHYTFDNNNFTFHCCFFSKSIPINTILEIKYLFCGLFAFTVHLGMLNSKGTIYITLFSTKNKSLKKMKDFFDLLSTKNNSCIINI